MMGTILVGHACRHCLASITNVKKVSDLKSMDPSSAAPSTTLRALSFLTCALPALPRENSWENLLIQRCDVIRDHKKQHSDDSQSDNFRIQIQGETVPRSCLEEEGERVPSGREHHVIAGQQDELPRAGGCGREPERGPGTCALNLLPPLWLLNLRGARGSGVNKRMGADARVHTCTQGWMITECGCMVLCLARCQRTSRDSRLLIL